MSTEWSVRAVGLLQFAVELGLRETVDVVAPRHPRLRPAHLRMFRYGSPDGVRVTELSARAGMAKQSMHELVTHLERYGYLRREPDPVDSRALRVRLTEAGWELQRQLRAASARVHLRWLEQLGPQRFALLWDALGELTARADPLPDPAALAAEIAAVDTGPHARPEPSVPDETLRK
jgi:DNA-binding MarR family transcriptional regulator